MYILKIQNKKRKKIEKKKRRAKFFLFFFWVVGRKERGKEGALAAGHPSGRGGRVLGLCVEGVWK